MMKQKKTTEQFPFYDYFIQTEKRKMTLMGGKQNGRLFENGEHRLVIESQNGLGSHLTAHPVQIPCCRQNC